jgi:hypothetical protein
MSPSTATIGRDEVHDPKKACPGLDPGWKPVFEQGPTRKLVVCR